MSETYPELSVILPVYNARNTLSLAISSVIKQSFSDFELIVLDDGSTDGSVEIVKEFQDPRLTLLSDGENRGLAFRLNQGISIAKGGYIARMDADDISFLNRFELQLSYLKNNSDIDLVSCKVIAFDQFANKHILPFKKDHQDIVKTLWKTIPMPHPAWMGRSAWFKKNLYKMPEVLRAEDQELLLRTQHESKFHSLPQILLAYRLSKFDLRKSFLARNSMLKFKFSFFIKEKQFINLTLVFLWFFATGLKDIFKIIFTKRVLVTNLTESLEKDFAELLKKVSE